MNSIDEDHPIISDLPEPGRTYLRRWHKPDGICLYCWKPANRHYPVGPIMVRISTPDEDEPPHDFCDWDCFGKWAKESADGTLVPQRKS